MRILVTGGSGFIGSHAVERLLADGVAVRCLVRRTSSLRWLPESVERVEGDLVSGAGLRDAAAGMDAILHVAGVTKARRTAEFYQGNVRATANLLRAAGDSARFVYVSSLAAVGPGRMLDEDAPPRPVTHYGRSKLEAEGLVGTRGIIVRPPVVFGPRDTDVFHLFRTVSRGRMVQIGRQERWFSFIYVKDLAEALAAAARSTACGTYFAAHPKAVSWSEFGAAAAGVLGVRLKTLAVTPAIACAVGWCGELWSRVAMKPVIISREKIAEARHEAWTCDPSRARAELGFTASTGLHQAVAETLAWYRKVGWLR